MAENWKHLKETPEFSLFHVYKNLNRVLLTSDLLSNISMVVGQLSVDISLAFWARDISTS